MRYLWSIPAGVVAWFVGGFSATYLKGLPGGATNFVPPRIDLLVLGGFAGGVLAGLLIGRIRIAVPVVLGVAAGMWLLTGNTWSDRSMVTTLLVTSGVGALLGAIGARSTAFAAFALALPVAWYALRPAEGLSDWRWLWQLNGLLMGAGLAILLYFACWKRGWRSVYSWAPVGGFYLASFAIVNAVWVIERSSGKPADVIGNASTDAFFKSFEPLLQRYWPWLVLGVLLAIPMVALKLRALPPPPPPPDPYAERSNDAVLSDDLDWIDRFEPRRKLIPHRVEPRREPVPARLEPGTDSLSALLEPSTESLPARPEPSSASLPARPEPPREPVPARQKPSREPLLHRLKLDRKPHLPRLELGRRLHPPRLNVRAKLHPPRLNPGAKLHPPKLKLRAKLHPPRLNLRGRLHAPRLNVHLPRVSLRGKLHPPRLNLRRKLLPHRDAPAWSEETTLRGSR